MTSLDAVCGVLARLAPLRLAESWDNVGLLVGDRSRRIMRIMTCLTISPNVVGEAIAQNADLIVAHHPLPFKPINRITSDSITGSMLLELIGHQIAVYSAHTAFDSAAEGINQMWGQLLDLSDLQPLVDWTDPGGDVNSELTCGQESQENESAFNESPQRVGAGRYGRLAACESLRELVIRAAKAVNATAPRVVGDPNRQVSKVALACGSGGSFLSAAARRGCDVMITGEATFHVCLEAQSRGIALGLLGHYFSERFAMEKLADSLAQELPDLTVWASQSEQDPLGSV